VSAILVQSLDIEQRDGSARTRCVIPEESWGQLGTLSAVCSRNRIPGEQQELEVRIEQD
jgi:hypothetical protein